MTIDELEALPPQVVRVLFRMTDPSDLGEFLPDWQKTFGGDYGKEIVDRLHLLFSNSVMTSSAYGDRFARAYAILTEE